MSRLFCEDWILYDKEYSTFKSLDATTSLHFQDIQATTKEVRVFGTKKQIKEVEKKYNIDEAYTFEVEKEGSFHYNPEDNIRIKQKLKEYKKLYELNNNEPLILRTK